MANLDLKKTFLCLTLGVFGTLGTCAAQTFSIGTILDPELVNIKAVDAPALHTENGKTGVGSEVRLGQGIIIDSAGIIATNKHIIGHARHIYVALSGGETLEANVLRNSEADLCLIKINVPYPLKAVSLADPSEIQAGMNVIAVANSGLYPKGYWEVRSSRCSRRPVQMMRNSWKRTSP